MSAYGPYWGDTMTVSVEANSSGTPTSVPVGKTQSLEMRIEVEETEYFSADSTLRDAVRHSEKVPIVNMTIGSWDIALHKQWLGGDGTSSTGLTDTSVPEKFDIQGEVSPVDDNTQAWQVKIIGVTFATLPFFSASRNEFIGLELEGRGDDVDIIQDPNPA